MELTESEKNRAYNEYYALFCLQTVFPERYDHLKHVGGNISPDLQDSINSIGVEVTTSRRGQEYIAFYDKWYGKPISSIPIEHIRKLHKAGYFFGCDNGLVAYLHGPHAFEMTGPNELSQESADNTMDSFTMKLKKLNGQHYSVFKDNEVFVFVDHHLSDSNMITFVEKASELQKTFKREYSALFLCKSWSLFCIDLSNKSIETHDLSASSTDVFLKTLDAVGISFPDGPNK